MLNSKILSLVLLTVTGLIGIVYYLSSTSLMELGSSNSGEVGAGYFPRLLAIILIALTIISIIQTLLEKKSEKVNLGNWKIVIATIIISAIYIFLWVTVDYFYIITFLFLYSLIYLYQKNKKSKRMLIINAITTTSVLLAIFVFFDVILNVAL